MSIRKLRPRALQYNERRHKVINKRAANTILILFIFIFYTTLAFPNFCKVKRNSSNRGYLFPSRADISNTGIAAVYYLQRKPSHVWNNTS